MPFDVRIRREFCASHQVRMYDGTLEPLHGHNWHTTVTVTADELDAAGFVVDFHALETSIDSVLSRLNNTHLNDAAAMLGLNPSTENVCLAIARQLNVPTPARLVSVEVTEAPGCSAIYRPE